MLFRNISEKTKRKHIRDIIAIYKSGKYKTLGAFMSHEKRLLWRLKRCSFSYMHHLLYKCHVLDNKKPINWHKMNLPKLQEAFILRWVDGKYRKVKDFESKNKGLFSNITKGGSTIKKTLNKHGFKTLKPDLKSKTREELEEKIISDFVTNYLGGKYKSFNDFRNKNSRTLERLSKEFNITATQLLRSHGYLIRGMHWYNMPIDDLESIAVDLWGSGDYPRLTELKRENDALFQALKKHYQTAGDVIVKSWARPKYTWLPYVLDYIVCNFLKKRIIEATDEEFISAVRTLSAKVVREDKKLYQILRNKCHNNFPSMLEELQEYAIEVCKKMRSTDYRKIRPPEKMD